MRTEHDQYVEDFNKSQVNESFEVYDDKRDFITLDAWDRTSWNQNEITKSKLQISNNFQIPIIKFQGKLKFEY